MDRPRQTVQEVVGVLVVVTRLQARGVRGLAGVARSSAEVVGDLRTRPGFAGGRLLLDRRGAAWTMTAWTDRAALDGFRTAHAPVAARIDEVASTSATTAWVADALPRWDEVGERWTAVPPPAAGLGRRIPPARVPEPSVAV